MSTSDSSNNHYAILIGIDAYATQPLKSCVRDVDMIEKCLKEQQRSIHIETLVARSTPNPTTNKPSDHSEYWPTPSNFRNAVEIVERCAKKGDYVYIHYSGHGTRKNISGLKLLNENGGDLALVLLKADNEREETYFPGIVLANILKNMVTNGLVVTVVLDCCFSSAVYRDDDTSTRYLPYDPAIASNSWKMAESFADASSSSVNRGISMRSNWILDPDGYAILAACGPHEPAKGGFETDKENKPNGVLSYHLSEAISMYKLGMRHKFLHRHLCARFRQLSIPQNPVLYGNKDQAFFGLSSQDLGTITIPIFRYIERLRLQAGQAHGLREGDLLHIYHLELAVRDLTREGSPAESHKATIAKICQVGPLTSDLELLNPSQLPVQAGWVAEPQSLPHLSETPLYVASNLLYRNELVTFLRSKSIVCDNNYSAAIFRLGSNKNEEYEILDGGGQKFMNLPPLPLYQTDTTYIYGILKHLIQFRMVKSLTNQQISRSFRDSFNIKIKNEKESFKPNVLIQEKAGAKLSLNIENTGSAVLYAHVYDMGPFWEITNILGGTYEVIHPRRSGKNGNSGFDGKFKRRFDLMFPEGMKNYHHCCDIIKVFVTSKPTSFDFLELPKVDELFASHIINRHDAVEDQYSEDWAAFNFPLKVYSLSVSSEKEEGRRLSE